MITREAIDWLRREIALCTGRAEDIEANPLVGDAAEPWRACASILACILAALERIEEPSLGQEVKASCPPPAIPDDVRAAIRSALHFERDHYLRQDMRNPGNREMYQALIRADEAALQWLNPTTAIPMQPADASDVWAELEAWVGEHTNVCDERSFSVANKGDGYLVCLCLRTRSTGESRNRYREGTGATPEAAIRDALKKAGAK